MKWRRIKLAMTNCSAKSKNMRLLEDSDENKQKRAEKEQLLKELVEPKPRQNPVFLDDRSDWKCKRPMGERGSG